MILFGTNFSVYYLIVTGRVKDVLKVSEAVTYFSIIGIAIALITVSIHHMYPNTLLALKDAAFQVGSIITTTGYSTTDFDLWPSFSKWVLILLMFCGACAGSTGGGMKVSRIQVAIKTVIKREITKFLAVETEDNTDFEDASGPNLGVENSRTEFKKSFFFAPENAKEQNQEKNS